MTEDSATRLATEFAEAFCGADLDQLETLLAEGFYLDGTLSQYRSRTEYIDALRRDPPERGKCKVLEAHGSSNGAAILYEYVKAEGSILIGQFTTHQDGLITEMRLVFDPTGV